MMDFESDKSKIFARNSSVGYSSRAYYYRSGEGVPFKWEMQPGIAKEPQKEELPPLSPPPALLGLGLPKPCIEEPRPSSSRSRILRYWKKTTRIGKNNIKKLKLHGTQECSSHLNDDDNELDIFARILDPCNSDSESMASACNSSFSSSSSSSLSIVKSSRPSLQSTSSGSSTRMYGRHLRCIPLNISRILVSKARGD